MTPAREAIHLPVILLTVTLTGGLRPGAPQVFELPSLFALVLGVLLLGALLRSGALMASRLMSTSRTTLANLNGLILLVTLFLACAQMFSLLTPSSGVPRIVFSVYFLVLMLNTWAAGPDRVHLLRSLAVTFGAAFVLNFVVLDALSHPAGRMTRVFQLLLEGVTLGALTQEPHAPAAGYIAFFTIVAFLMVLALLPGRAAHPGPAQLGTTGLTRPVVRDTGLARSTPPGPPEGGPHSSA
jgi:hypothetical protein